MKNRQRPLVSLLFAAILLYLPPVLQAGDVTIEQPLKADAAISWEPSSGVTPAADWSQIGDGRKIVRFNCPFASLNDWRVCWDKKISVDLSGVDQIVLVLRTPDPEAVAEVIVYFESGAGWYGMQPFGITSSWQTVVLRKDAGWKEGSPAGWSGVGRIRIGILPAEKRDTYVELRQMSGRRGWPAAHIGMVGPYTNFKNAAGAMANSSKGTAAEKDVNERLARAAAIKKEVDEAADVSEKAVQKKIMEGRKILGEAYALIQSPVSNELRGFWAHQGDGIRGIGSERAARWKEAVPMIKSYGFNAIFPNVLWSGVAFYPSRLVDNHPGVAREGDYLQELVDACRAAGVELHPWKVMWQFAEDWLARPGVSEPFRRAGRLQRDSKGKEVPWLCPSDPRNQKFELDSTLEMAKYDIRGIHLDYIRYDGDDVCYCKGCRKRFERQSGEKVSRWPADVLRGGPRGEAYAEWKRGQITYFVRVLRTAMKKKFPALKLSAAVFSQPEQAKNSVFQDWAAWAKEGLLDFVCTMTYTEDVRQFRNTVRVQADALQGTIPLYVGMMVVPNGNPLSLDIMVDEILATRGLGAKGFVFFELEDFLQDSSLPFLKAGLTRTGEYDLSFREIPASQRPSQVRKGEKLAAGADGILLDDFEDNDTLNALETSWAVDSDANGLGTVLKPNPLELEAGGAAGSKYCVRIRGHYGKSRAPWPWALLLADLSPVKALADLNGFKAIELFVKGDGKLYESVLIKDAVKDFAHFRQSFTAPREWTRIVLPLENFNQPGWGKREEQDFSDVRTLQFGPSGMDDEDFDLSVDNIRLIR